MEPDARNARHLIALEPGREGVSEDFGVREGRAGRKSEPAAQNDALNNSEYDHADLRQSLREAHS
jgi:hypothetical protein